MENLINESKKFLSSNEGKQMNSQADTFLSGGKNAVQGAVGAQGTQGGSEEEREGQDYTGFDESQDAASEGGYGANTQGDSFSRSNQMGTDAAGSGPGTSSDNANNYDGPGSNGGGGAYGAAFGTGNSTPAYKPEDDGYGGDSNTNNNNQGQGRQTQGGGGSMGLNPYGNNDDTNEPEN